LTQSSGFDLCILGLRFFGFIEMAILQYTRDYPKLADYPASLSPQPVQGIHPYRLLYNSASVNTQKTNLMTSFLDWRLKRMGENVPDLEQLGKNRNNEWISVCDVVGIHHLAESFRGRNLLEFSLLSRCAYDMRQ
jgi:hypothetical protein